jgi:hypothetical protein
VLKGEILIWKTKNPNSRIQFVSNQSKLVPRKLDPGPLSSKVSLSSVMCSSLNGSWLDISENC